MGLERPVAGLFRNVIEFINRSKKRVLAIDVPSGIHSDTGEKLGIAICASVTGTLGAAKRGLREKEGPKHAGKISVLDISIPRELL